MPQLAGVRNPKKHVFAGKLAGENRFQSVDRRLRFGG